MPKVKIFTCDEIGFKDVFDNENNFLIIKTSP